MSTIKSALIYTGIVMPIVGISLWLIDIVNPVAAVGMSLVGLGFLLFGILRHK